MKALIFLGLAVIMFVATVVLVAVGNGFLGSCTFISMIAGLLLALRQAIRSA